MAEVQVHDGESLESALKRFKRKVLQENGWILLPLVICAVEAHRIEGGRVRSAHHRAAALVHELIEARDEKRLLRYQKNLARQELLIVDELGFVPLSKTGASWPAWTLSPRT